MAINQAIYQAQLHLTQGRRAFKQKQDSNTVVPLSHVWLHFEKAQKSIQQLQLISKRFEQHFYLKTTTTQIPIHALLKINKQIKKLKKEANEQWSIGSNNLVKAKHDVQFDKNFERILIEVTLVQHTLDEILEQTMEKQLRLQLFILLLLEVTWKFINIKTINKLIR